MNRFPPNFQSSSRYFVPDLSPRDRGVLSQVRPRFVFVAESPHIHEVEPDPVMERRPLCGAAGRVWWKKLSEVLNTPAPELTAEGLIEFCFLHRLAVINAVQVPLDPKVTKQFPAADPYLSLGFQKDTGVRSYKKRGGSFFEAVSSLRDRVFDDRIKNAPLISLGNDADWLLREVLGDLASSRILTKIPHPSAWWRRGGFYGDEADRILKRLFF